MRISTVMHMCGHLHVRMCLVVVVMVARVDVRDAAGREGVRAQGRPTNICSVCICVNKL